MQQKTSNMKNRKFHLGYTLIILAGGLLLFEDKFDGGLIYSSIYGVLALIGFVIMIKSMKCM